MKIKIKRALLVLLLASGIQLSLTTCTNSGRVISFDDEPSCEEEVLKDTEDKVAFK